MDIYYEGTTTKVGTPITFEIDRKHSFYVEIDNTFLTRSQGYNKNQSIDLIE